MKGEGLRLGPWGNQEKIVILNVYAFNNNISPNSWQRRDGLLRRDKAWLKTQNARNTVLKTRKRPRRKSRTRQDKDRTHWPAWSTGRMWAHTVTAIKPYKALWTQLLLNKQIPWTGDISLEGIFYGTNISTFFWKPWKTKPKPPPHCTCTHKLKTWTTQVKHDSHFLESPLLSVLSRSLLRIFHPSVKLRAHDITNSCPEVPTSLEALLPWWACPTQSPTRLPPSLGFQPCSPGDAEVRNGSTATVASTAQNITKLRALTPLFRQKSPPGAIKCKEGKERGEEKQSLSRKTG